MRRKRGMKASIAALSLAVAILAGFIALLSIDVRRLGRELERRREELLETRRTLDEAMALIGGLAENLRESEATIEALRGQIGKLNEEIEELGARLDALRPRTAEYFAIGISEENLGEVISVQVTLIGEENWVSIDLSYVSYGENLQKSAKDAAAAVAFLENRSSLGVGVVVRFGGPDRLTRVDGPSAGAAMAIAIYACLHGKQIDNQVLITGAIRTNATIGWVGSVEEKAIAARDWGARLLLVPRGQRVNVQGIEIVEVSDLREALAYVLRD
ncbi:MAG: hypothetical protein NZ934_02250 [Hadesarchaea archaeon]|nr:hypothetical protein [Hadesarchaea archaeon]